MTVWTVSLRNRCRRRLSAARHSRRYASTGGWGFGRFINGVPADIGQHQTCFACHQARVKNRDFVFTRLAP